MYADLGLVLGNDIASAYTLGLPSLNGGLVSFQTNFAQTPGARPPRHHAADFCLATLQPASFGRGRLPDRTEGGIRYIGREEDLICDAVPKAHRQVFLSARPC